MTTDPAHRMADPMQTMSRIHEICDFLYLSGASGVRRDQIRKRAITCIVNCTVELPNLPLNDVEFINVKIDDSPYSVISKYFDECADRIEYHRQNGGNILVHCMAGISRSSCIVIAYLLKHQNLSLRDAFFRVRKARPIANPNPGFWKQLIEYEYSLRKVSSVKMVPTAFGMMPDIYSDEMKPLPWVTAKQLYHV